MAFGRMKIHIKIEYKIAFWQLRIVTEKLDLNIVTENKVKDAYPMAD